LVENREFLIACPTLYVTVLFRKRLRVLSRGTAFYTTQPDIDRACPGDVDRLGTKSSVYWVHARYGQTDGKASSIAERLLR